MSVSRTLIIGGIAAGALTAGLSAPVVAKDAVSAKDATARPAKRATFSGRTTQKRTFSFRTSSNGKHVEAITYRVDYRCGKKVRRKNIRVRMSGSADVRKGRFRVKVKYATLSGRFTAARRAKGTLRVRFRVGSTTCDSKTLRWTARA